MYPRGPLFHLNWKPPLRGQDSNSDRSWTSLLVDQQVSRLPVREQDHIVNRNAEAYQFMQCPLAGPKHMVNTRRRNLTIVLLPHDTKTIELSCSTRKYRSKSIDRFSQPDG